MGIKCVVIDSDETAIEMIGNVLRKIRPLQMLAHCHTETQVIDLLNEHKVSLAFVDLDTPGIKGKTKILKAIMAIPSVVVMSKDARRAKEAYDLGASDFLLKPLTMNRLMRTVSKLAKKNMA